METVQSSQTSQCSTHTSSYTEFIEKIFLSLASGSSLILVSRWQLLDLVLKQHHIILPVAGEKRSSSRVSRYRFFTSFFLLHTNELFNNSDGQWDKLSANSCGHSSGREEPSTSGSACLSSQVLLGWNQLRASVLALQRDHLQVRMKTCFPSADGQVLMFLALNSSTTALKRIELFAVLFSSPVVRLQLHIWCRNELDETLTLFS